MVLKAGDGARPQAESGCGWWALVGLNKDKVSVSFISVFYCWLL